MKSLSTIQRIIADQTGLTVEELLPTRPLDELGVDSLAVIEAMFLLEDEFKVEMPFGQFPIRTIQDIADLVDHLLQKQATAKSRVNAR